MSQIKKNILIYYDSRCAEERPRAVGQGSCRVGAGGQEETPCPEQALQPSHQTQPAGMLRQPPWITHAVHPCPGSQQKQGAAELDHNKTYTKTVSILPQSWGNPKWGLWQKPWCPGMNAHTRACRKLALALTLINEPPTGFLKDPGNPSVQPRFKSIYMRYFYRPKEMVFRIQFLWERCNLIFNPEAYG